MHNKLAELLREVARRFPEGAQELEAAAGRLETDGSREAKQAAAAAYTSAESAIMAGLKLGAGAEDRFVGARYAAEDAYKAAREALAALS
jgi:hypothetical protein